MTNGNIQYTSIDEQIEKLKQQNLIIENEAFAKETLSNFGYSSLIKSYREPYVVTQNDKKVYRSGVTFEQIYSLYLFDKNLRNAVMASMLDLEEHIKGIAADVVAQSFGVHQDDYLKFSNFKNKPRLKKQFSLSAILESMHTALNTNKNPIYHYKTVHGIVPPWILFKSAYLTTIVNFINLFKTREQKMMAERLYDMSKIRLDISALRKLMMDTLYVCIEYRNMSAHGGRIYNYSPNSKVRYDEIFGVKPNTNVEGFSQLLFLLSLLKYRRPYEYLNNVLANEVNRHTSYFPQDITFLKQVLNVDITFSNTVYVSGRSLKYHADSHCSGIKNPRKMDYWDAEKLGYTPCKKCAKDIIPYV